MAENWESCADGMLTVNLDLFVTYRHRVERVSAGPPWPLLSNIQRTVPHPAIVILQGTSESVTVSFLVHFSFKSTQNLCIQQS